MQQLPCVIPGIPGGAFTIDDSRTENKLSGTAVLSFKPTDRLLTYASYSRGYKAGGFNLDRSALWRAQTIPTTVPATPGTAVLTNPPLSGSGAICVSPTQSGLPGYRRLGGGPAVQAGDQQCVRAWRQVQWPRIRL